MSVYMICYDLNRPAQDYSGLHSEIKKLGPWWHHLDSTWLVKTSLSVVELRDHLKGIVDQDDEVLVVNVTHDDAAWHGFNNSGSVWLKNNLG